jgi:single-strand DNA-binding protein|tara:strand:+ start:1133 stop:1561 length:429 start_codon:yes stop_codon:yes gene_type:complete
MSGSLNKVMLIGHLGDDIKMHYFDGGGCVGRFSLATNETYNDKSSGEKVTNTDWHNILVRNKAAEICQKYLSKGDKVYLEGRLKTRKWTAENGQDRYTTEVNVDEFTFLNTSKVKEVSTEESPVPKPNQDTKDIPAEDDLPF